jgi:hypothetical protein
MIGPVVFIVEVDVVEMIRVSIVEVRPVAKGEMG